MAGLIDTSVVVEVERRGLPTDVLDGLARGERFVLAAITASELLAGVHRSVASERRRQREAFVDWLLDHLPVLPFDLPAARVPARLGADMDAAGQRIGANDLLIAASALAHGHAVLTHNLRDFEREPGLVVRRPQW